VFGLAADDEEGAEIYSAATTRDQAKIVHGDARAMLEKKRAFAAKLGIVVNQHVILRPVSNGKFEPLSREAKSLDGKNVHIAIIDELHAHPTREVYDVIETACSKRYASLMWIITTAGSDMSGICYEVRTYSVKLLEGMFEDDSQFAIIYTMDEGDDWMDPRVWQKANPNWGVSVMPDNFASLAQKAMQLPSAQANFKTKHLNIWVNAMQAWMRMQAWAKAVNPNLDISDFELGPATVRGENPPQCFVGLDLASKIDVAAKAKLFTRELPKPVCKCGLTAALHGPEVAHPYEWNGELEKHFYCFLTSYLPEAASPMGATRSIPAGRSKG
jgi:phage terminase large subunit-like protein